MCDLSLFNPRENFKLVWLPLLVPMKSLNSLFLGEQVGILTVAGWKTAVKQKGGQHAVSFRPLSQAVERAKEQAGLGLHLDFDDVGVLRIWARVSIIDSGMDIGFYVGLLWALLAASY